MPDSSLTKRALAQAIKELMNEKPLVKISIADIVDRCQMNRQSFYYHFRDKYDLVNWIFYTELITELQNSSNKDEYEELKNIFRWLTGGAKLPPDEFVGKIRSALAISPENQRALLKEAARGALTNVPWN